MKSICCVRMSGGGLSITSYHKRKCREDDKSSFADKIKFTAIYITEAPVRSPFTVGLISIV